MTSDPNLVEQIVAAVERRLETGLSGPGGPVEAALATLLGLLVTGEAFPDLWRGGNLGWLGNPLFPAFGSANNSTQRYGDNISKQM